MNPAGTHLRKLVGLLHLASPTLPIGGFSYSQGLEAAVESGLIFDEKSVSGWIRSGLEIFLAEYELPLLATLHRAWEKEEYRDVTFFNEWMLASRETGELRLETEQMGWSLAQLALQLSWHDPLHGERLRMLKPVALPTAFAFAAGALGIDCESCLAAYSFAWAENQVSAAIKAIPLGQVSGQKILFALHPVIPAVVSRAIHTPPEGVSTFAPHLAILSSRHSRQYSRLFRS